MLYDDPRFRVSYRPPDGRTGGRAPVPVVRRLPPTSAPIVVASRAVTVPRRSRRGTPPLVLVAAVVVLAVGGFVVFSDTPARSQPQRAAALTGAFVGGGDGGDAGWDRTVEGYRYAAPPSIPESLFLAVLRENDSPIPQEEAAEMYRYAVEAGYDPAILLGHIRKETSYGKAGAGRPTSGPYSDATWGQYNIGGLNCTSWGRQSRCGANNVGAYASYLDAGKDHIDLMMNTGMYHNSPYPNPYLGKLTVRDRIDTYAPASDCRWGPGSCNDPTGYMLDMERWIDEWRERARREFAVPAPAQAVRFDGADSVRPFGNPLQDARTVMTQGYGVGTHAPAATWGGIDLAIDGNGDGVAEPGPTMNAPIYATHSGTARVVPNSSPGGNYISIENDQYRTAYAHLSSFAVSHGQSVHAGELIGYVGSTGMSSGPHLHYEVWERQNGSWVNVNPLDFGGLE